MQDKKISELIESLGDIPASAEADEICGVVAPVVSKYTPGMSKAKALEFGSRGNIGLMCGLGQKLQRKD